LFLKLHPTNYGFRTYMKQLNFDDGDTDSDTDTDDDGDGDGRE
jgi:hypothetical protein